MNDPMIDQMKPMLVGYILVGPDSPVVRDFVDQVCVFKLKQQFFLSSLVI